ncbi:Ornithine decarboxylase [Penicillium griseofulvum]|uniref:ornithine decarboxylase n=1 Tax=Penicillium patulum TaxID=5078 RepID=A0A135LLL4_PENPA|nr:Ornithine decarboxylase [Penicillium griseofulvum]KXG49824.1 Ornithine decarboxylase [Penicillium griseofulvum]
MALLPAPREAVAIGKVIHVTGYRNLPPDELVDLAIESHIARIVKRPLGGDESFFVADLGQILRQHRRWTQNMRGIRPYYAVKCNCDPTFLKVLSELGTGFDCASIEEIRAVLSLGVDPARILFANPCKAPAAVAFAREVGVLRTTFDNIDELDTISAHMPEAQLLLRIYANDEGAFICLGEKFGAQLDTTEELLSRAWELGLNVIGVSFHVGTGATNPESFCKGIKDARLAFSQAERLGFRPKILDIGGGFQDDCFESMAPFIREAIRSEFPVGITTIAEPGRFFARNMLYQNDGIYGNFMNVIMEKEIVVPYLVKSRKRGHKSKGEEKNDQVTSHRYSIWGPTCDSTDCVVREVTLDSEVKIGDWIKYKNMGAYTSTTATQFNGFSSTHDTFYVNSETLPDY